MHAFLIGFATVFVCLLGVVIPTNLMFVDMTTVPAAWQWNPVESMSMLVVAMLTVQLVALPVVTAWAVAEFVVLVRGTPRGLLRSASGPVGRSVRGFVVGLLALFLITLATVFASPDLPDSLSLIGATSIATFVTMMFARRSRRGYCVACQFDLQGQVGGGICPECGFDQFDAVSPPKKTKMSSSLAPGATPPMIGLEATA